MRVPSLLAVLAIAALAATLGGCASASVSGFTRGQAQADVARWSAQAVATEPSRGAKQTIKFNGYEACRSDTGLLTTSSEWRTITDLAVPLAEQSQKTAGVAEAFGQAGWKVVFTKTLVTMTGPKGASHKGLITVQSAGESQLAISVLSPCYG